MTLTYSRQHGHNNTSFRRADSCRASQLAIPKRNIIEGISVVWAEESCRPHRPPLDRKPPVAAHGQVDLPDLDTSWTHLTYTDTIYCQPKRSLGLPLEVLMPAAKSCMRPTAVGTFICSSTGGPHCMGCGRQGKHAHMLRMLQRTTWLLGVSGKLRRQSATLCPSPVRSA